MTEYDIAGGREDGTMLGMLGMLGVLGMLCVLCMLCMLCMLSMLDTLAMLLRRPERSWPRDWFGTEITPDLLTERNMGRLPAMTTVDSTGSSPRSASSPES